MRAMCAAHRGLSKAHPENTARAFEAAIDAGFHALEMDLRLTRDGEVVVHHDAGIERTTNGNGRVADMRYDELRTYQTGAGPVPRLDDLFEQHAGWGGWWDLEIKAREATPGTLALIAHHNVDRVHISSMDPSVLMAVQTAAPATSRGMIVLGPPDADDLREAQDAGCTWMHCDNLFVKPETIAMVHDAGMRIGAWTVNDPDDAVRLAKQGVECIITDVDEVRAALASQAPTEPRF